MAEADPWLLSPNIYVCGLLHHRVWITFLLIREQDLCDGHWDLTISFSHVQGIAEFDKGEVTCVKVHELRNQ